MRQKYLKAETHLKRTVVETPDAAADLYYLNADMQLVHMFLTIDRYARHPSRIKDDLGISTADFDIILTELLKRGFIERSEGRFIIKRFAVHLSPDSPLYRPHFAILRQRCAHQLQRLPREQAYGFSATFSATEEVRREVHRRFLEMLREVEPDIRDAACEGVYQMEFSLFPWTYT